MITKMRLGDYLDEHFMTLDLRSGTKREAIEEVASLLRGSEKVKEWSAFLADVYAREELGSTGVGKGVGIPHARTDNVTDFVVAFGRSKEGIDFGAVDGKPVRLVFLMGTPNIKIQSYLKLLAHMSRLFKIEAFLDSLHAAPDAASVIELFRQEDR